MNCKHPDCKDLLTKECRPTASRWRSLWVVRLIGVSGTRLMFRPVCRGPSTGQTILADRSSLLLTAVDTSCAKVAWCDEEWPVRGWHFASEPIEWVKDIPKAALDAGEGYNLWRQFIHILPDGRAALFYNSGYYGREQLYLKVSDKR